MSRIFVSHASADAELVDRFVDTLLRNGCNLDPEDFFYSSGEDTGVPSGRELIAAVRQEVSAATLVVALITPTYQMRPVCIAELGAAWAQTDRLMPLMVPGMPRSDLEGVLSGMTIRALDESAALDELHDRVREATGVAVKAATWTRHKQRWQKELPELLNKVPAPTTITLDEVEQLHRDLDGAKAAVDELEAENAELRRQRDALKELKDVERVAEVLLPQDEKERFWQLVRNANRAVEALDRVVKDAIWADRFSSGLAPQGDEYGAAADKNINAGLLVVNYEGALRPDASSGAIRRAQEETNRLQTFLTDEASEAFDDWFENQYDFPPDLTRKAVWDELLS